MRRCAQFQIEFSRGNLLTQPAVDTAKEAMLFAGGALNRRLLGARALTRSQAELLDARLVSLSRHNFQQQTNVRTNDK
jgi:hypothetical protein